MYRPKVADTDLREARTPAQVALALETGGYLPDEGLATAVLLALRMQRPLFLEGEPGVGKTEVARTIAKAMGAELLRLQCHEGIDAAQAVYEWDYSRQILHLRAAEAAGGSLDARELEDDLFTERYLVRRPLLAALDNDLDVPPVLLIDEIDRSDDEFEAFLLEALADYSVTVPEVGTFTARRPPVVVLTSNRTRDVHDALKRRCLYHWVEHPDLEREVRIISMRAPRVPAELARQVASLTQRFRQLGLYKPPGVAESIDWAVALDALDTAAVTADAVGSTLGAVLKYREDQQRVQEAGLDGIVAEALAGAGT
ncbi:MAG: MoxR family ATPase [Actinomycetia bacterium]|nr:MoxR family ATPase [Actinomycetes bacterium]